VTLEPGWLDSSGNYLPRDQWTVASQQVTPPRVGRQP
jgi:hypothetical protein